MNCDQVDLKLDRKTAERLYAFLYRSEKDLCVDLIHLLDTMEREVFSSYTIAMMETLTGGDKN